MAFYAADGSININVVSGASYTGLYATDGSINTVVSPGTLVGAYHPCGAWYVKRLGAPPAGQSNPIRNPDGSLGVTTTPYTNGGQRVTVLTGVLP